MRLIAVCIEMFYTIIKSNQNALEHGVSFTHNQIENTF